MPKQFRQLAGRPVLTWAIEALLADARIDGVTAVIAAEDRADHDRAIDALDDGRSVRVRAPVVGGETRQHSVFAGLQSLRSRAPDIVLIHDGARPRPGTRLVARVVEAVGPTTGAVPAIAVTDTLNRGSDGHLGEPVARDGLYRIQTPQGFPFAALFHAFESVGPDGLADFTDDAGIAAASGLDVQLVAGEERNMKITGSGDLEKAARIVAPNHLPHIGQGFDVHRFGPGDHVTLCGVAIAHPNGLMGHSDADVGLHALTDAILGALADGDIGQHFPPSDERWKGAASSLFLDDAVRRVAARGGRIAHVDVTLICERPKIGPHREAMRLRLAELLGIGIGRIGIKATTTEGLGFTGRGEGIAAQAVATLMLAESDELDHG